jgi:hypothetical protein
MTIAVLWWKVAVTRLAILLLCFATPQIFTIHSGGPNENN